MRTSTKAAPSGRYSIASEEKIGGETYTPKGLADFVALQVARAAAIADKHGVVKVLDPAAGDGELLMSLLEQLGAQGITNVEVHGFETNLRALNLATARIKQRFPAARVEIWHRDFLDFVLDEVPQDDVRSLFKQDVAPSFDLVIANPPYVRTQVMGADLAQRLARQFGLTGRVDLYHAFMIGIGHVLRAGGIGGIIVSNRFLTTKSGQMVRQAIREHFSIRHLWDLGDTRLFDAAVLPAVLLVEKTENEEQTRAEFTSIYATVDTPAECAVDVIDALDRNGLVGTEDGRSFIVKQGYVDIGASGVAVWRLATADSDNWLKTVEANTWKRFGDIGKIRVGVKTCADKVFIRSDWDEMPENEQPELLRAITTHHVARQFRAKPARKSRYIVYPHESVNGQRRPVDLAAHPKTRTYLEKCRDVLEARRYVIEGGRNWYELWVPHDPSRWEQPKLVFRDISEEPTFWVDLEGNIVNGDCYWLTCDDPEDGELLWLAAAVANSRFIESYYDHCFNNKLYAGRRRFITQYVERFPLPDAALPDSQKLIALAKQLYEDAGSSNCDKLARELDNLVCRVFGVAVEEARG